MLRNDYETKACCMMRLSHLISTINCNKYFRLTNFITHRHLTRFVYYSTCQFQTKIDSYETTLRYWLVSQIPFKSMAAPKKLPDNAQPKTSYDLICSLTAKIFSIRQKNKFKRRYTECICFTQNRLTSQYIKLGCSVSITDDNN
jgi:hypothetical protein